MHRRAGYYKTNLTGEAAYKSFVPTPLPPHPAIEIDDDMLAQLIHANNALSSLESIAKRIPDMDLFVSMYVRKEALLSSQIEGTQATLEDIFDPMIEKNINRDVADVVNYIKATEHSIERLKSLPLCNRLIKEAHAILMTGVRGQEKNPGEFRRSQNWIGSPDSSLKEARFIPPNTDDMIEAMSELERYMNEDNGLDTLMRTALIHYQFETIHPFLDGNGRIGRLLVTLFLRDKKLLSTPALYISYFLKKNRIEYYDRLSEVRHKGNYEQWIRFFLLAIAESAKDAIHTIDNLTALRNKNLTIIEKMGRASQTAMQVFWYLEKNPMIDIGTTAEKLGISFNTVSSAVNRLMDANILVQTEDSKRNRIFAYEEYLGILRKGT